MVSNFLVFVVMLSAAIICSAAAISVVYLIASNIKDSLDNAGLFTKGHKKSYQERERLMEARKLVMSAYEEAERKGAEENKVILHNLGMAMYIMNECMD